MTTCRSKEVGQELNQKEVQKIVRKEREGQKVVKICKEKLPSPVTGSRHV